MPKLKDLTGMTFERLTVINRANNIGKSVAWNCKCNCSNQTELIVIGNSLVSRNTKSCGCLNSEMSKIRFTTHGKYQTRLYNIWREMKARCHDINNPRYKDYGGRGIKVCQEWLDDFMNFYNWSMDNGYSEELEIDRIENNGIYEPSNCRWTTREIQCRNQRIRCDNSIGIRGVCLHKSTNKYRAYITSSGITEYLGYFNTIEEAAEARKQAEMQYWVN